MTDQTNTLNQPPATVADAELDSIKPITIERNGIKVLFYPTRKKREPKAGGDGRPKGWIYYAPSWDDVKVQDVITWHGESAVKNILQAKSNLDAQSAADEASWDSLEDKDKPFNEAEFIKYILTGSSPGETIEVLEDAREKMVYKLWAIFNRRGKIQVMIDDYRKEMDAAINSSEMNKVKAVRAKLQPLEDEMKQYDSDMESNKESIIKMDEAIERRSKRGRRKKSDEAGATAVASGAVK